MKTEWCSGCGHEHLVVNYVTEISLAWDAFIDGLSWICLPTDTRCLFTAADELQNAATSFGNAEKFLKWFQESCS